MSKYSSHTGQGSSKYFNLDSGSTPSSEVRLYEDLITEAIKLRGFNCWYIPRESWNDTGADRLYGEDPVSKFGKAYLMEMYITTVTGFGGEGDIFSQFGHQVRDSLNVMVAQRRFEQILPTTIRRRPQEGDLIYVPLMNHLFEVNFVENDLMFFQAGNRRRYVYEMRCNLFRYSHEQVETGVSEIDDIIPNNAYSVQLLMGSGSGNFSIGETVTANNASSIVSNWTPSSKILIVMNNIGYYLEGDIISGANASYHISHVDDLGNFVSEDHSDNRLIKTEANNIIDTTEKNPFGYN